MNGFHVAQICEKGHVISSYIDEEPEVSQNYCVECGAPTITACQHCGESIPGRKKSESGYLFDYIRPTYCHRCGKPYPWTLRVLSEIDKLNSEYTKETGFLKDVLSNIIVETPSTAISVMRLHKFLETCAPFVADVLKQFIASFACESALQFFGFS